MRKNTVRKTGNKEMSDTKGKGMSNSGAVESSKQLKFRKGSQKRESVESGN